MFTVYILRTSSNTLYIGQTNNLEKRLKEHQTKGTKSAKYTRYFSNLELVYSEIFATRKEAMQREIQLKKWPKANKEALVGGLKKTPDPQAQQMKLGKYQHSKTRNFYRVIGTAKHSETLEELVVYEALYENPTSKLWVRPVKMFLEKVEIKGKKVPRFEFVGE